MFWNRVAPLFQHSSGETWISQEQLQVLKLLKFEALFPTILVIGYYDYHLMTLSFACFISFQREKRELELIGDHIYNIIV